MKDITELMFHEVYRLHGLLRAIISDQDVLFTSLFWMHLNKLIGVHQKMSSAYHPEIDGSTKRANWMVRQMLWACIGPTQRDWVTRLPAIKFMINIVQSESTRYTPFFLNTGRMPRAMIWDSPRRNKYPKIQTYTWKMKLALMMAHDTLLATQVKQTVQANTKQWMCLLEKGDLVYISTRNISYPKGTLWKLVPKFIEPYHITEDFGNNSYRIDLLDNLKQRGIHNIFHLSLLRIHIPSDDRLFPGRRDNQLEDLGGTNHEWAMDKILCHRGSHSDTDFEIQRTTGDRSWLPYHEVSHLRALADYFEAIGVTGIENLGWTGNKDPSDDDLQVSFGHSAPHAFGAYLSCPPCQRNLTAPCQPQSYQATNSHSTPPCQSQHPHPRHCQPLPHRPPQQHYKNKWHHQHNPVERYINCINCRRIYFDLCSFINQQLSQQPHQHTIINPPHSCWNPKHPASLCSRQPSHYCMGHCTHPHLTCSVAYQCHRNIEKSGPEFYSDHWSLEEGAEDC